MIHKKHAGIMALAAVAVAASVIGAYALTSSYVPVNPSSLPIPSQTVIHIPGVRNVSSNETTELIIQFRGIPGNVLTGAWSANAPIAIAVLPVGVYFLPHGPKNWSMEGTLSIHLWNYTGTSGNLPYRLTFFAPLGSVIKITQTIEVEAA